MSVLVERKQNGSSNTARPHGITPSSVGSVTLGNGRVVREPQSKSKNSAAGGLLPAAPSGRSGADGGAKKMNKMAVQKVDGGVCDLLSTVPQVVLYQYEADSNTWERTCTEGTLFIYSRSSVPSHGFVLLNRLSSDNLMEMVQPGSDFRVQEQFVLFKKCSDTSRVYGLCFSDSQVASATGQLLNQLSVPAAVMNKQAAPLSVSMRSQSVPSFPHTQQDAELGERVDILELLETAGNSYLNQAFSDETGSSGQDSPPSETISFTAHPPPPSSLANDRGQAMVSGDKPLLNQRGSSASNRPVKRNTLRTIPKLVNMSTTPPSASLTHPPPPSSSLTPSHLVQSQVQYSARAAKSASKPTPTSRQFSVGVATGQTTPRGEVVARNPLRSSTAPAPIGKRKLHVPPPTRGGAGPAHQRPTRSGPASSVPLQEVILEQSLARQLFDQQPPHPPHPSQSRETVSSISSSTQSHLESLFSQSLPAALPGVVGGVSGGGHTPSEMSRTPPTKLMSLAEVEKQMSEEVPSPDHSNRYPLFGLHPVTTTSSLSHPPPVTTGTPSLSTSTTSAPVDITTGEELHVLRQPSSFSVATPPSRAMTMPLISSTTGPPNPASVSRGISGSTAGSGPVNFTPQRTATSGSVQLNIEPPSPVVVSTKQPLQPHKVLTNGVFPDVPPLMHSPGMRAPPVSHEPHRPPGAAGSAGTQNGERREAGGAKGKGRRGGKRSPGRSGSPVAVPGESSSPQAVGVAPVGVAETPPSRSWSVPNNMTPPEVSVVVPTQPATHPHTLLSPQQFSLTETTPPPSQTATPPPPPGLGQPLLSREQFKQALIYLIQYDEDFVSHIHQAYHLSAVRKPQ